MTRLRWLAGFLLLVAATHPAVAESAAERGSYLVEGIANCGNCHAPQEPSGALPLAPLSGGPAVLSPAFTAYPPNITPHPEDGIGAWTAEQVVTALRERAQARWTRATTAHAGGVLPKHV